MYNLFDLFNEDIDSEKYYSKLGYNIVKQENKVVIVHNVLGINKEDLKISYNKKSGNTGMINLVGQTKDEITGKVYSINSNFTVDERTSNIDKITSNIKNGILYITIPTKKPEKEKEKFISINID